MKKSLKNTALAIAALLLMTASVVAIEYFGGHPMGLFSGTKPDGLGFINSKFKPPSWKPNTVSSTVAKDDSHYIAPLAVNGDMASEWKKLLAVLRENPRATVITEKPGYVYAEFKSAGLGFVDDVEFALDGNVIQVRSASRLGVRDFDVNRKRIESIRAAMQK